MFIRIIVLRVRHIVPIVVHISCVVGLASIRLLIMCIRRIRIFIIVLRMSCVLLIMCVLTMLFYYVCYSYGMSSYGSSPY